MSLSPSPSQNFSTTGGYRGIGVVTTLQPGTNLAVEVGLLCCGNSDRVDKPGVVGPSIVSQSQLGSPERRRIKSSLRKIVSFFKSELIPPANSLTGVSLSKHQFVPFVGHCQHCPAPKFDNKCRSHRKCEDRPQHQIQQRVDPRF